MATQYFMIVWHDFGNDPIREHIKKLYSEYTDNIQDIKIPNMFFIKDDNGTLTEEYLSHISRKFYTINKSYINHLVIYVKKVSSDLPIFPTLLKVQQHSFEDQKDHTLSECATEVDR